MKPRHLFTLTLFLLSLFHSFAGDSPRTVRAVRVTAPPRIDGMLDEDVWKLAQPATDFIQRDPDEGKPATERTEVYVLYDDHALYFGCIFHDSEPNKIVARLTRRDDEIESDNASIRIDSYHDHRTGYEFTFNAAGVKVDILQYDDANREDESWDPVWELETKITSQGWIAEVKIPFHILRYRTHNDDSAEEEWGINILRHITRKQEDDRWVFTPKSQSGFISRFGHLIGLRNLPSSNHIELLPFVVAKQRYAPPTDVMERKYEFKPDAGLDLKYHLSTSFTLDATVNPDFGQVEADPAVLNLSTFETLYPEKRPFFIEGTQILRFTTYGEGAGPGMFYSRRIGRAISIDEAAIPEGGKIETIPQNVSILGAAKISGKTSSGLSIGILEAVTKKEQATVADSLGVKSNQVLEPFAHYNVIRLRQDVMNNSTIGMIFTSAEKQTRSPVFTNGYDWSIKFDSNTYSLDGFFALSHTISSDFDRVTGLAGKVQYAKIAGEHWLWSISFDATTKNYYINDVGYFRRPNDVGPIASVTYKEDKPGNFFRNYTVGLFLHERSNFDGVNLIREVQINGGFLFLNYWSFYWTVDVEGGLYDDRETRGNGLYSRPTNYSANFYGETDNRNFVIMSARQNFGWNNRSRFFSSTGLEIELKPLPWMMWEFESAFQRNLNQEAWVNNIDFSGTTKSIFGDRTTDEFNFTLRSTITFTRELTLQMYGQIFLAKGHYKNFRMLNGTSDFTSYAYTSNHDFNRQSFNTNIVLRWEYLPGCTAYLVWSQARDEGNGNYFTSFGDDFNTTFKRAPTNVIMLKVSYWLNM